MLNNIYFVALHVLMCTMPSFAISSQGCLIKFVPIVILLIGSLVRICSATCLPSKSMHIAARS